VSDNALNQHRQESKVHAHRNILSLAAAPTVPLGTFYTQVAKAPVVTPSPAPLGPITCRGSSYTALSDAETKSLQATLATLCHTLQCLWLEDYAIATSLDQPLTSANSNLKTAPRYDPLVTKREATVPHCEMVGTSSPPIR